ncbi:HET-domain-containing protein, partial [Lophium mytilinum]
MIARNLPMVIYVHEMEKSLKYNYWLEIFMSPNPGMEVERRYPHLATRPLVESHAESAACLTKACRWLKECIENHIDCNIHEQHPDMPKRVLYIQACPNPQEPYILRLISTDGGKDPYVALSHCWGLEQPLTTNTASLDSRMNEIVWSQLPKTFQDAIKVTATLGYTYIWVDSLCIIQDSQIDWEEQSAQMATIYEKAVVTLAAASATGDTEGFLAQRPERISGSALLQSCNPGTSPLSVYFRERLEHYEERFEHYESLDPLETRAWAFQERVLATRALIFSRNELRWECNTTQQCECGGTDTGRKKARGASYPYSRSLLSSSTPRCDLYRHWYLDTVRQYSRMSLTQASDILPALSGIAHVFSKLTGAGYFAGIWQPEFLHGLLWKPPRWTEPSIQPAYRAPSFSWASTDEEVSYPYDLLSENKIWTD